jgi:hypothetical protein
LSGVEAGLVSAYEFDEATPNDIADLTGLANGHSASSLTRVGSLARIGDGTTYLLGSLDYAAYGRFWAIQNSPNFSGFPVAAQATLRRFYDFGPAPGPVSVTAALSPALSDATSQSISLQGSTAFLNTVTLTA